MAPVAGSGSENGGAGVPRASMVDSVAMPARVGPQRRHSGTIAECGCSGRWLKSRPRQVSDRDFCWCPEYSALFVEFESTGSKMP